MFFNSNLHGLASGAGAYFTDALMAREHVRPQQVVPCDNPHNIATVIDDEEVAKRKALESGVGSFERRTNMHRCRCRV